MHQHNIVQESKKSLTPPPPPTRPGLEDNEDNPQPNEGGGGETTMTTTTMMKKIHQEKGKGKGISVISPPCAVSTAKEGDKGKSVISSPSAVPAAEGEDNGRERLKRHRVEVAGRVWIPEKWGKEELLKDWSDCCAFDASLINSNIMSARKALMEQATRANNNSRSRLLRVENSC